MKKLNFSRFLFILLLVQLNLSIVEAQTTVPILQWLATPNTYFEAQSTAFMSVNTLELGADCNTWAGAENTTTVEGMGVITRYSGNGSLVFEKEVPYSYAGNSVGFVPLDMEADMHNNLYYVGQSSYFNQPIFEKISPTGAFLWSGFQFFPSDAGSADAVEIKGNNVYVAGNFTNYLYLGLTDTLFGSILWQPENYLVNFDTLGNVQWKRQFPFGSSSKIKEIIADNNGFLYMIGTFQNSLTIDGNTINAVGNEDIFIAKFNSASTCVALVQAGGVLADKAFDIELMANGNLAIAGACASSNAQIGSISFSTDGIFSAIFNQNLTALNASVLLPYNAISSFQNVQNQNKKSIQIDKNAFTYVTTNNNDIYKFDANGAQVWHKTNYAYNFDPYNFNANYLKTTCITANENGSFSIGGMYAGYYDLAVDGHFIAQSANYLPTSAPAFVSSYYDASLTCSSPVNFNVAYTYNQYDCGVIEFNAHSYGAVPTTYSWYAGNTLISTTPTFSHTFHNSPSAINPSEIVTLIASTGTVSDTFTNTVYYVTPIDMPTITQTAMPNCSTATISVTPLGYYDAAGNYTLYDITWENNSSFFYGVPSIDVLGGTTTYISISYIINGAYCSANNSFIATSPFHFTDTYPISTNCSGTYSVCVVVGGGTPPYSYSWQNGSTSTCLNNLVGNQILYLNDANNCAISLDVYAPAPLNSFFYNTVHVTNCSSNGSVCIGANGGTAPYSYSWSNGATTNCINNLSGGNYTCWITDANGCTNIKTVTINSSGSTLNATLIPTNINCNTPTGSICANISGGTAPYTYSWSNGANTNCISNLSAGNYSLAITDANGCFVMQNTTISATPFNLNPTQTNLTSNTANNGSICLNPTGATPPLNYSWSNGGTTNCINNLSLGTYSVNVSDANGCVTNQSFNLTNINIAPLFQNLYDQPAVTSGAGAAVGSRYVTNMELGNDCGIWIANYDSSNVAQITKISYAISNTVLFSIFPPTPTPYNDTSKVNDMVVDIHNNLYHVGHINKRYQYIQKVSPTGVVLWNAFLPSNNYSVSTSVAVKGNAVYVAGYFNGSVSFNAQHTLVGWGHFLVKLDTLGNVLWKQEIPYIVRKMVIDNNGFLYLNGIVKFDSAGNYIQTAAITNAGVNDAVLMPNGNIMVSGVHSNGANIGGIILNGDYIYSAMLNTSLTVLSAHNLLPSTYIPSGHPINSYECFQVSENGDTYISFQRSLYKYDINGTLVWQKINYGTNYSPYDSIDRYKPTAIEVKNGSFVVGGTYSYFFQLTIDALSHFGIFSFSPPEYAYFAAIYHDPSLACSPYNNPNFSVQYTYSTIGCGLVNFNQQASAGTPTTYSWYYTNSNGALALFSTSPNPTHTFYSDGNSIVSVTLIASDGINADTVTQDVLYSGVDFPEITPSSLSTCSTATLTVSPTTFINPGSFATDNYDIMWSNGTCCNSSINVGAGTYTVQITNPISGCTATSLPITITSIAPNVSIDTTNINCTNSACAIVTNGLPPYNYYWSNTQTSSCITNISSGNYWVSVSDANGCSSTENITINAIAPLNVTSNITSPSCNGGNNGSACLTVSGGTAPYNYSWSNNATTSCLNNVSAGNYSVAISDANGCSSTENLTINAIAPLNVTSNITSPSCNGGNNGSACLTVSGGTLPYSYSWSNNTTSNCLSNVIAGTYLVNVNDANGCISTQSITITQPVSLALTTSSTNVNGATLGSATATPSGGTPPYAYSWSNNATSQQINNLNVGNYTIFVTDANGCQINQTVVITNVSSLENVLKSANFVLYPNPNKGNFRLKSFENVDYEANISIFDVMTKCIYSQQIILKAQAEIPFHLEVSQGTYFLKMETKEGVLYQKVVIE